MAHPVVTRLQNNPNATLILVVVTLILAFAANLYGLFYGISIVIPHLFYIPIILAAFFFPRRGVPFAIALSAAYFLMVAVVRPGNLTDIISAAGRCIVYILIAVVVSYLADRVRTREKALSVAKEEWERTFNAVPDLIALIDREHHILRINRAMAQSLGIPPEQAVGMRCYEIVHKSDSPPASCPHAMLLADGKAHSSEIHDKNLGGDFIVTTSPLTDADGTLIGSVHVARDISERKRVEDALREKTDELDRFFSVNLDLLCIADTDGNFRRLNVAWERTLGYTREELMAHKFLDFIHPDDLEKTLAAIATLTEQREVTSFINRYRCKDGSYRWIEWRSYPSGKLIYAAARDITERIQAQQAIVQANAKLNILSSVTRHDILNKITALYAYLDLSRDFCTTPAQCEHIEKEITIVQALQRQVEFTKYYQDLGIHAPEWQDIEMVFTKAVSQIPREGLSITIDTGGYAIYADPLIEKVFYNLAENSLRHGEHVTALSLTTEKIPGGLLVIYRDNGVGIPADIKDHRERGTGEWCAV